MKMMMKKRRVNGIFKFQFLKEFLELTSTSDKTSSAGLGART